MAFDQNLIPKDLRPLNMTRVSSDEPRIGVVSTSGRPVEGIYSDAEYGGGLGFGNRGAGVGLGSFVANWGPRMPVPVGMPAVSTSGYVSSPNVGPQISGNGGQVGEDGREDSVSGKKVKFLCSFGGKILPRPSDGMLRYVGGQTRIAAFRRDVRFSEFAQKMVDMFGQPVSIKYQVPDEDLDALVSVSSPDDLENMMDEYEKLAERSPDGSAKLRMFFFSSDLESSGDMGFGDLQDGGQRYVHAVNGIMERVGSGITRKQSNASVTSNQNSDVSGAEAADTTLIPADISVPPPATVVSPKGDNPSSNDNMVRLDVSSVSHPDSHAAVLPVSNAKSSPKAVSSQPEIMLEKPVAIPAQQQLTGYDLQQVGARYVPPPSAYLQGYADAHQDSVNLAEFQKLRPPQVVYLNPQVVPSPGQMLIRTQYHETTTTFAPQPFIPAGAIAMTPSSHLSMNPNIMHPLAQQRVFAPSADQSYTSYQAQVPHAGVGGSYGWCQVTPQNHMGYSEGWIPNPQVMLSDKLSRVAECYYCQKQLPHAHSETVVHDERDSSMTTVGTNPAYHSVNVADLTGVLPGSKIIAGGPVREVTLEQASRTGVRALAKMNNEGGSPQGEITGTRDSHTPTRPGNGAEANMEMHLLDVSDYPTGNVNKDYISKQPHVGKEFPVQVSPEEMIKQELQATAEGVAASVFQSSAPPTPVLGLERELQLNSDTAAQAKLEGVNIKSEVSIFGFPLSNLGRLQIIKNSDLEELRELGSGTFDTVYRGKWRGSDVTIKRINERCFSGKPSEQDRMSDDFWNEAINLADLHHPNVVAFYGVVLDGPGVSVATVTEYMVNGSLRTALHERNLDKRKRLLIAMDVAFGMEYLHSKSIVHFDLKSDNLLVNLRDPHRPICKVGDLGLSKVKCQTLISGGVRGTLPWMAPEFLNGTDSLVSEKVDVFSFGIVMWELLTGDEPYRELHYGNIIGGIVMFTLRPAVPDGCDPDWRSLMERCWSAEPSERPSFTEIANELRAMATKLQQKGQTTATNTRTNA
ncbi:putative serine/threonine-protein kinase [Drosera capensis]